MFARPSISGLNIILESFVDRKSNERIPIVGGHKRRKCSKCNKLVTSIRVFILGIDGASYDIILPLVRMGKLPTFEGVLKNGAWGNLTSTQPPLSPLAWTSMATGLNPGEHGVFDFISKKYNFGRSRSQINTSESLRGITYWDYASSLGRRVIVYNHPFTYPPYRVNGILLSGFPCPIDKLATYPKKFDDVIKTRVGSVFSEPESVREMYQHKDLEALFNELSDIIDFQSKVIRFLMEEEDWDLLVAILTALDRAQHVIYGLTRLLENHTESISGPTDQLSGLYIKIDRMLSRIIELLDNDTVLLLVSDHGFEKLEGFVGINNWLEKQGHLTRKKSMLRSTRHSQSLLRRLYYQLGHVEFFSRILRMAPIEKILLRISEFLTTSTDISESSAWAHYSYGIHINRSAFSDEKQLDAYKKSLTNEIVETLGPGNVNGVLSHVLFREEIYSGNKSNLAPDIVLVPQPGYEPREWVHGKVVTPVSSSDSNITKTGTHYSSKSMNGIFMAYGRNIAKRETTAKAIYDIAPTTLWLLGIEPPPRMIGEVAQDILVDKPRGRMQKLTRPSDREMKRIRSRIRRLREAGKI